MNATDPTKQQYHTMIPTSDDRMTDGGGWRYHERGDDARNERLIKWKDSPLYRWHTQIQTKTINTQMQKKALDKA